MNTIKSMTIATLLATTAPVAALAQADVSVGANGGASTSVGAAGANAQASGNVSGNASGNAGGAIENGLDRAGDAVQDGLDRAGDAAESGLDRAGEAVQAGGNASGSVDADGAAEADGQGEAEFSASDGEADGSIQTHGQLISSIQTGEIAETADFANFTVGTDGEVTIVSLSELQGGGAEAGAALDGAIDAGAEANYSQLPASIFEGTEYGVEDVVAVFIDAEGNLVVVVDANA